MPQSSHVSDVKGIRNTAAETIPTASKSAHNGNPSQPARVDPGHESDYKSRIQSIRKNRSNGSLATSGVESALTPSSDEKSHHPVSPYWGWVAYLAIALVLCRTHPVLSTLFFSRLRKVQHASSTFSNRHQRNHFQEVEQKLMIESVEFQIRCMRWEANFVVIIVNKVKLTLGFNCTLDCAIKRHTFCS